MAAETTLSILENLPTEIIEKILERLCDTFEPTSPEPTWDSPVGTAERPPFVSSAALVPPQRDKDPITGSVEERGLLSACLASRRLSPVAMRLLYRHCSIGSRGWREPRLFARTLAARGDLAQCVRVLFVTVRADRELVSGEVHERWLLTQILGALPALQELAVNVSDEEMRDPISNFVPGSLGSVRKLFIRDSSQLGDGIVQFPEFEDLLNATAANLTQLSLSRCDLYRDHPDVMHGMAELPHLATLELHSCFFGNATDLRGFVTHTCRHGTLKSLSIVGGPVIDGSSTFSPSVLAGALEPAAQHGLQSLDLRPDMDQWWASGYREVPELPRREVHHRIEPLLRSCTTLTSLVLEYSTIAPVHRAETQCHDRLPEGLHSRIPEFVRQRKDMNLLGVLHALPRSIQELTITNIIEIPEMIIQLADSISSGGSVQQLCKLRVINLEFLIGELKPKIPRRTGLLFRQSQERVDEQPRSSLLANEACVDWLIDEEGDAGRLKPRLAAVGITLNIFTSREPDHLRADFAIWKDRPDHWTLAT